MITETFYHQGYNLSMESAKALYKAASKSAEIQEYGIARALNILSAEEAVKGVFIFLNSLQPEERFEDWNDFFRFHPKKHKAISIFMAIMHISNQQRDELISEKLKSLSPLQIQHMNSNELLRDEFRWYQERKNNPIKIEDVILWWEKANTEKNNSLYVGENCGTWHNPRSYSVNEFIIEKRYTEMFIECAERVVVMMNRSGFKEYLFESLRSNNSPPPC